MDWLKKLSEFLKFFNEAVENVENYKYFLFTGFDADNVINIIINNYNQLKNKIVSYIGPIINENCMVCMEVLHNPNKEYNDYILTNEFIYLNEELYDKISDFFGVDFEIKRQKKNFNIKIMEIMIFNKSLHKRNTSVLIIHLQQTTRQQTTTNDCCRLQTFVQRLFLDRCCFFAA